MAEWAKFSKEWYDAIKNDKYNETTELQMALIIGAAALYQFNGEAIDIGAVYGEQYRELNRSMSTIYDQIDRINNRSQTQRGEPKYDEDAIYELAIQGMKASQVWEQLGYPMEAVNSIYSNKGWKRARQEINGSKAKNLEASRKIQKISGEIQNDTEFWTKF